MITIRLSTLPRGISYSHNPHPPKLLDERSVKTQMAPTLILQLTANQERSTQPGQRHMELDQVSLHHTMTLDDQLPFIFK